MSLRRRLAAALPLALLCAAGCGGPRPLALPPRAGRADAPERDTIVRYDERTGRLVLQRQVLRDPERGLIRHGHERGWYADGRPRYERWFDQGEPGGRWRSWHADGTLRSDYDWEGERDGAPPTMRFWHENGVPSAEGPARRGLREGHWRFWYPSGVRREEGEYAGNARHGEWRVFREDGALASIGRYANGRRVGAWQHFPPRGMPPAPEGAAAFEELSLLRAPE